MRTNVIGNTKALTKVRLFEDIWVLVVGNSTVKKIIGTILVKVEEIIVQLKIYIHPCVNHS